MKAHNYREAATTQTELVKVVMTPLFVVVAHYCRYRDTVTFVIKMSYLIVGDCAEQSLLIQKVSRCRHT